MTFYVKINEQVLTDGVSVFPFSFGQLLDERLGKAYLHTTKSVPSDWILWHGQQSHDLRP